MRKSSILSVLVTAVLFCNAQKITTEHFKNFKPRNIGPAGMSGRVTAVDASHSNPDLIYVGTASGGVWKTENGGSNWVPVFYRPTYLDYGASGPQEAQPAVVWAGTGEGNPRNSIN